MLTISIDALGWVTLTDQDRDIHIPPDELDYPYGPDLPNPYITQTQCIGRWLKRDPGWYT